MKSPFFSRLWCCYRLHDADGMM